MATSAANPFPSSSDAQPDNSDYSTAGGSSTGTDYGTPLSGTTAPSSSLSGGGSGTTTNATATRTTGGSDLLNRVVQGAHETIDRLAETAAPHVQRLQDGMATANETLHSRADQARETGDEWAESLRTTVRENPLAAVATALAVGVIISRLTQR